MKRIAPAAIAAVALLAAGCGGGGGGSLPEGAAKSPAEAVAFVSLDTDASSDQWQKAKKLAARFPGGAMVVDEVEKYRQAVGPEVDLAWLDFANDGDDFVILTKPSNLARLKELAAPDNFAYAELSDGWVAIGDQSEAFKKQAQGDKLDSDGGFKDAFGKLDSGAAVRAWVRGPTVQALLDRALVSGGAAPRITHEIGDLKSISADVRAEDDGATAAVYGTIDPAPDPATFSPSLPDSTPGGALLYVSATGLDAATRIILRMVGESNPRFETQLDQVQGVLGITLEGDIYPLLKGESALAVYRGGRIPPILYQLKVDDEQKADRLLRRFSSIAAVAGGVDVSTDEIEGRTVQKLTFTDSNVTVWDGVAEGRLFVTNARELARETIAGPEHALADDDLFRSARKAADLPGAVIAFAYGDLEHGLPYVFRQVERGGDVVPPAARANTKPLQTSLVYTVKDGDSLRMSGFVTIK